MKNILVIEDSKPINKFIKKQLTEYGFNVEQAFTLADGKEFLNQEKFDLIILDMHLPDGEGYELIHDIQSLTHTKVIVLTSYHDEMLRNKLFEYGVLDYIIKDKNLAYAITEIKKIIDNVNHTKKDTILVIDDSKFICKQIKTILEPRNYILQFAHNAQEGLKILMENEFNLVILDMELPDKHGLQVLEEIRHNQSTLKIPVIVLSGTATPDIIRKILKNGANDFLRKPFVFEEFILKVGLWIDYFNKDKIITQKTKELEYINTNLQKIVQKEVEENKKKDRIMFLQTRYAQMGEMISMIAHQWRQPLNVISLAINILEMNIKKDETLEMVFKNVKEQLKYLDTTIEDFRTFFKPEKEKQATNFELIVQKSIDLIDYLFQKENIEIRIEIKELEEFLSYENELVQVVLNILKNSYDVLKDKKDDKLISIFIDKTTLIIEDNGGGIADNIIDKVFDVYFSTKNGQGTGLGLYMSKLIVEVHCNGKIDVENGEKGARFIITLPKK